MPSLLHILKMMMNAVTTSHPMVEYSTHLFSLFLATPLLLLFFSTILLPLPAFVYAHSSTLPFPLLFYVVFQWCSLLSCCYELQNFENMHNFQQETQTTFNDYLVFFVLEHPARRIHFYTCLPFFN